MRDRHWGTQIAKLVEPGRDCPTFLKVRSRDAFAVFVDRRKDAWKHGEGRPVAAMAANPKTPGAKIVLRELAKSPRRYLNTLIHYAASRVGLGAATPTSSESAVLPQTRAS